MKSLQLICLLLIFGHSAPLLVGPVRLVNLRRYISFEEGPSPDTSLLECPYTAEDGEEVQEVHWKVFKDVDGDEEAVGTFTWKTEGDAQATGLLEDYVALHREDGNLEFTALAYELGGKYSCSVTVDDGQTGETAPWEVLLIHQTSGSVENELSSDVAACTIRSSITLNPIYPEPTVHSGLYSASLGGFFDQVTPLEWHKTRFDNGSVQYSYQQKEFQVNENTPLDTKFLTTIGVTKSDNNYISLNMFQSYDRTWKERGCAPLRPKEYQVVEYSTEMTTCRGKRLPSDTDPLKATITCDEGYKAAGDTEEVMLACDETTWEWKGAPGQPRRQDLRCVIDNSSSASRLQPASVIFIFISVLFYCQF